MAKGGKKRTQAEVRLFRDEPVLAPPSPYWTVVGLIEGEGWYERYQARTEQEGKRYLGSALDDDSGRFDKYDDIGLLPPAHATKGLPEAPVTPLPAKRTRTAGRVKRKAS